MSYQPSRVYLFRVVLAWTVAGVCATLRADSLTVLSPKHAYDLYEPIVVYVELRLDEPYSPDPANPAASARQLRRVTHRRLDVELRSGDDVLCQGMALVPAFEPLEGRQTLFRSSGLVVLGSERRMPEGRESAFDFWGRPGAYALVLVDRDNGLESNQVPITIRSLDKAQVLAGNLFASGGLRMLPALIGDEHGEPVRPVLERLVREHSGTIFGKYARMSLALMTARQQYGARRENRDTAPSEIARELEESAAVFPPGHPLRSMALLYHARVRVSPDVRGDPEAMIAQLLQETHDDRMISEARLFLRELERIREYQSDSPE